MNKPPRRSNVWLINTVTIKALGLFLIIGMLFVDNDDTRSIVSIPPTALFSIILACVSFGSAIMANVSAFLNPSSPHISRFISPILLIITAVIIIPFFVSLGLTMTRF